MTKKIEVFASEALPGELEAFPDIKRGWGTTKETTGGIPPMKWFNAVQKRTDEWLLYLTQRGIPEWDASLDYPKSAVVTYGDVIYISLKVSKGEQPNTTQSSWSTLAVVLGLDKKLDKSAVVQNTGASEIDVMSQSAVTRAIGNVPTVGRLLNVQTFTVSGTYTPTSGANMILVEVQGAGGSGGSARATSDGYMSVGSGGGGGGYGLSLIKDNFSNVTVTVGSGGDVGGGTGGKSSFGDFVVAQGGQGPSADMNEYASGTIIQRVGGSGGVCVGGNILNITGGVGGSAITTQIGNLIGGYGGASKLSNQARGGSGQANNGVDGILGGGGGGAVSSSNPNGGFSGGKGGDGIVFIWEYA